MESYKRFEMVLSMDKCLKGIAFEPVDKGGDVHMSESSSTSFENHLYSDIARSTPFMVANTPINCVDDILNDLLTPAAQPQSKKETFPGKNSVKYSCFKVYQ